MSNTLAPEMRRRLTWILGGISVVVVWSATFYVHQTETAIVFQLGNIRHSNLQPGLHFQIPFINNVRKFDNRVLALNAKPELFLTSEKKNVSVDFYVKWRIQDVSEYYRATQETASAQREGWHRSSRTSSRTSSAYVPSRRRSRASAVRSWMSCR